ncbi:MAG TPA: hypothetical protein VL752_00280 [Acidisoma sp.]|uniref:hypothetical protein n=1 Tax=Acidisoma sp. TaxID=1872115 RepID=UPI002CB37519|nr:hypothetical protein [Acidisoma sp.]HTH99352.1 hypothetical protein [Acidisoma sp.]
MDVRAVTNEDTKEVSNEAASFDKARERIQIILAMPLKRQPSEAELDALAAEFRLLGRPGDVIRPWLQKQPVRIKTLVADDWSWATVADALTRAGNTYRTKRPWTGDGLKSQVRRAALPLLRAWLEAMDRRFAGISSWIP